MRSVEVLARLSRRLGLLRRLDVPAIPRVPRWMALLALRFPRLVPIRLRWRSATDGLGLVVASLTVPTRESKPVPSVLESIGEEQGRGLREQLGYGRTPLECARAVALANRMVGISARAEGTAEEEARVITPGCPWSRHDWWGPAPCGAFSRYEIGLARGLNSRARIRYESKRTRGDDLCVGVYSLEEGARE